MHDATRERPSRSSRLSFLNSLHSEKGKGQGSVRARQGEESSILAASLPNGDGANRLSSATDSLVVVSMQGHLSEFCHDEPEVNFLSWPSDLESRRV